MQLNPNSSTTLKLNLSYGLKTNALSEADRIGISLQDFIRMLMATYFAKSQAINAISRDKNLLSNAKKEIRLEKYTKINSSKQLRKKLSHLDCHPGVGRDL